MKNLSIIIPVYFNADNLSATYKRLQTEVLDKKLFDYEIIFVDDGSTDDSFKKLKVMAAKDEKIKVIKLSKNFGSHLAILAGLEVANGDCVTMISADLQDPPEIILKMFTKWQDGNKVVLAVRQDRQEPWSQTMFSNLYYWLMKKYALANMPTGGFDCFLIDRRVAEILSQIEEKNSSLMGQILWCGFKTANIYYTRQAREIGRSRWTLTKKIKLLVDSFTAFSYFPIRIMSGVGCIVAFFSFIYGLIVLINRLFFGAVVQGWTALMIVVLLTAGVQMFMLGIIGEYLWRSFDESRKRPPFIIEEKINL